MLAISVVISPCSINGLFLPAEFCPRSVCPLVTTANYGKTTDSVEMPFGVLGQVGPRNRRPWWDWDPDPSGKGKIGEMGQHNVTYKENATSAIWDGKWAGSKESRIR